MNLTPRHERHNQTLSLDDGRTLGFAEYGDFTSPETTIIYLHGLPGSRFEAALIDKAALALHVRIIAPDRPGMGLSTRKADRKVIDYPPDIAQLVKHQSIQQYAVLGVSGGGMYALACAAQKDMLLPGLQVVSVVAGLGPRNFTQEGMSWAQRLAFFAMDIVPKSLVGWLWDVMIGKKARNPDLTVLTEALKKALPATPGPDSALYQDDAVVQASIESIRGAFIQGSGGYTDEAVLVARPWGFDLASIIGVNVKLWYGGKDTLAPPGVGRALAERIEGAQCTVFDESGHTGAVLNHLEEMLITCKQMQEE